MLKDRYDLDLSTGSVEARDRYIDAVDRMLAADGGVADAIAATIEADPGFALAHAAMAREHQLNGRIPESRASADQAWELVQNTTRRERQHVEIIRNLVNGQLPLALEQTREHVQDFPRDAFALNPSCGVFGTIGFSGRPDREAEQLALVEPLAAHYGEDWWFQTVHAFALLETGQWARGRELAERALEQRPTNAHGAHTLAHALFEAGQDADAVSYLAGWIPEADRDSLLQCHMWWHYALLLVMTGDLEGAYNAFAENCLPGTTASPSINVFTDSVAFLWRAELAGASRNKPYWEMLKAYYHEQFPRPFVFVDAHVGLVHAALEDWSALDECIAELEALGEKGRLPAGMTAANLTRAYRAFAQSEWDNAIDLLEPAMADLVRIGGSRAQRDLQTNTLLAAYVNADRPEDAAAFLAGSQDRQPSRPVVGLVA